MKKILTAILIFGIFAISASSGADTQTSRSTGDIFLYATRSGDLEKIKVLLKDNPALVCSKDKNGITPLHVAAREGHKNVAGFLLTNKAQVNAKANDGATPLHCTARNDCKTVAKLLLVSKADVNARLTNNVTPLHLAAAFGSQGVVRLGCP